MTDLLTPVRAPYEAIYESLREVRELFHKRGRIADANAKLDETVKLMAIHYARETGRLNDELFTPLTNRQSFSIKGLNSALAQIAKREPFVSKGRSIFGISPTVAFEKGEEQLAFELFKAAGVAIASQSKASDPLDVVNEAFGHHVRDNFRSNTEDAQYMTPPEVVEFMVSLAAAEIFGPRSKNLSDESLVVVDPSCGVGSFLVSWHRIQAKRTGGQRSKVIGQDKVDRMARLAKANLIFSGFETDDVYVGNSLDDEAPLSAHDGQVDLILTNPPFGARFSSEELAVLSSTSLPVFSKGIGGAKVSDSELLFIERYLTLLKPGGLCVVVLPDGVISAKGAPALVRQLLTRNAELVAIVELPPVTFAQAGTRTKTAVLAFRKSLKPQSKSRIFFAEAHDLGFEVSKRKGVPIKKVHGENELLAIEKSFVAGHDAPNLARGGFAEWHEISPAAIDAWTPRRFRSLSNSRDGLPDNVKFDSRSLSELVKPRGKVKTEGYTPGKLYISVLHIIGEGVLDVAAVHNYRPVTPGLPVRPGRVIISRINPRIPRAMVVPDLGAPLLCSSEFEVLEPLEGISPYALAFLLLSSPAHQQICSLTAGTSASHSRVNSEAIRSINLPWPVDNIDAFNDVVAEYERANRSAVSALMTIHSLRNM